MLASYAKVFNAVEGNTTFYHVPTEASIEPWRCALDGTDCKISFKLPKTVTHSRSISTVDFEQFSKAMAPIKENRGPYFLQFPASIGPNEINAFEPIFERIADASAAVIEVRHPGFFSEPESLEPYLHTYGFGRVIMDSRSLYQGNSQHPDVKGAVHEKPDLPVIPTVYNNHAFVRLVLHPDGVSNDPWLSEWAQRVAQWLSDGVEVTQMIHCPNNQYCPDFARDFHNRLIRIMHSEHGISVDELPAWPVPEQGSLW